MKTLATTLAALCLATGLYAPALPAQTKPFTDPANLGGERVKPRDGRELPVDQGSLGLQQLLRRLNTRASIMNIVAHPDDEDGGMMTLYSRGMGARVADLSLTRGEGGQNAMTGDFEDALGLLRTQELLSCDRYSGVDQFFGTEVDFGFSKTKEEAFAKWTHERVLYDVVRAIRIYRPLVLTSTWVGGVTDGHGQHQVSGEIAQEAFNKAGDPKVFPEMIAEGILPWQPLKVYARVSQAAITAQGLFDYATAQYTPARFQNYVTGEVSATPPSVDVVVHEGDTDPLLADTDGKPRSYVQFARIGLSQQKSQMGPGGRMPPAGKFDVSYHRYGSRLPKEKQKAQEESFFDGIDTSLEGIVDLAPEAFPTDTMNYVSRAVHAATEKLDPAHPEAVAPSLLSALQNMDETIKAVSGWNGDAIKKENALHELRIKRVQLNDALILALGISLEAIVESTPQSIPNPIFDDSKPTAIGIAQDSKFYILTKFDNGLLEIRNSPPHTITVREQPLNLNRSTYKPTRPYFSRPNIEQPFYDLSDQNLRNAPQTPPAQVTHGQFDDNGVALSIDTVVTASTRLLSGETFRQPISIVPSLNVSLSSHAQVLPANQESLSLDMVVTPSGKNVTEEKIEAPSTWNVTPASSTATCIGCFPFHIEAPAADRKPATLTASAKLGGHTYTEGYRPVGYGDLPRTNYYTPASVRIVPVDLKLPAGRRIGYLPGTGDAVPEALASIGLKPEMLTVADLTPEKLKQYDSVVLGVRTYAAHPDLHGAPTQALLDYAKSGGNVVVQYQATEFTGDDAPYPLALARYAGTVVDETAPVKLLDTGSPLLTTPNKITPADFNGWVEERGHGFLSTWDSHYTALTETHDPGAAAEGIRPQDPQRGGLVTVKLGEGRWTYLAFAVYRQLPEAVPGAFRLFVNLLQK